MYGTIYVSKTELQSKLLATIIDDITDGYHTTYITPFEVEKKPVDSSISPYTNIYFKIELIDTRIMSEKFGTIPTPTKGGD